MINFLLSVRQIIQFQFWPHRRYCHVILGLQLLRKYGVLSIFRDGCRGRSILLLVSYLFTILEFYFWFRSRPFSRNLHFILHQPAEFRPNRNSHCENITSYRFIKMAAADAEYCFRFRICRYRWLQKVKVNEQTKFRRHMSIDGWDLATSVFKKKRPPYWNSTSGFDLDHFP